MNLKHLRYFLAAVETLHFGKAAEVVGMAPSPFSRSIRNLERQLNVKLFSGSTRFVRLTFAGEKLLPIARRIGELCSYAEMRSLEGDLLHTDTLNVGLCEAVSDARIGRLMSLHQNSTFNVRLHVTELQFSLQIDEIAAGTIDLGFSHSDFQSDRIISERLWSDNLIVVCSKKHQFSRRSAIQMPLLRDQSVLLPHMFRDSGALKALTDILNIDIRSHAMPSRIGQASLLSQVAAGLAITIITQTQAESMIRDDIVFRPLASKHARLTTYLHQARDNDSPAVAQLVEDTRRIISKLRVQPVETPHPHPGMP